MATGFAVLLAGSVNAQEFKVAKNTGRLEIMIGRVTVEGTSEHLARIVDGLGLTLPPPGRAEARAALGFVRSDKKARKGRARYVLLERPGRVARAEMKWSREVPDEVVEMVVDRWSEGD